MNTEIFAVAISNALVGVAVGLALGVLSSNSQFERMNTSIQQAIDNVFQKDTEIDELRSELKIVKMQYEELYDATETSRRALESVKNLPPPSSPLVRCENYVDKNIPRVYLSDPRTPLPTCEPSSTD